MTADGRCVVVDTGPAATADALADTVQRHCRRGPDLILLTHIHIDHAGGAGHLARRFPRCPIFCHPKAIAHLADPQRLWQGSLATLGDTARAYGPMLPVPQRQLHAVDELDGIGISAILTPGHAPHHVSFQVGDTLFAGEAGGVFMAAEGSRDPWLRPATPPRFFLDVSLASIDRLLARPPATLCYGHYGSTPDGAHLLQAHRRQLKRWARIIDALWGGAETPPEVAACLEALLAEDPLLAAWPRLPEDVRRRERTFLGNSIRGFLGYLETSGGSEGERVRR